MRYIALSNSGSVALLVIKKKIMEMSLLPFFLSVLCRNGRGSWAASETLDASFDTFSGYLRFLYRCIPSISSALTYPFSIRAAMSLALVAVLQSYSASPSSVKARK